MSEGKLFLLTQDDSAHTTLVKRQLLASLKDAAYRAAFVSERVRSAIALQIRALREQRNGMTQKELGEKLGMAQTWVSKLENPEYGKMTVTTLLRLANVFDTDLEIKFRPFSTTLDRLPSQGSEYFRVASFEEELPAIEQQVSLEAVSYYWRAHADIGRGNILVAPQRLAPTKTVTIGGSVQQEANVAPPDWRLHARTS